MFKFNHLGSELIQYQAAQENYNFILVIMQTQQPSLRNIVIYEISHTYGGIQSIKGCMRAVHDKGGNKWGAYSSLNIPKQGWKCI